MDRIENILMKVLPHSLSFISNFLDFEQIFNEDESLWIDILVLNLGVINLRANSPVTFVQSFMGGSLE